LQNNPPLNYPKTPDIYPTTKMKTILIIGATRNLGKALQLHYATQPNTTVFATGRYGKPVHHPPNVHWISGIDISHDNAGRLLALNINHEFPIDIVYFVATASSGLFVSESLDDLKVDKQLAMYKTTAIGPLLVIQQLLKAGILAENAKIIFIGNEAGCISLANRGCNFGFHGSQAALNMIAKLLSLDLTPKGIAVGVVYPGRFRLEDDRHSHIAQGDVRPEVAADALVKFVEEGFDLKKTGQIWASRGFRSVAAFSTTIANANITNHDDPIQLPY
jgi:NAD(P)-dependent dehydrogenase (short-subunit alcohol dehydrogenase family)